MKKQLLYKDRNFTAWTLNRVAEVLCEEWSSLKPELSKDIRVVYGYKATRISFKGEVNVTLDISKQKYPNKDFIEVGFGLSLSPDPDSLNTHVLNTFDLGTFVGLFPEYSEEDCFSIAKTEPWEGALFSQAARTTLPLLETLLKFETCFNFLISDSYKLSGEKLDMSKLELTQYLNRVKAYRLAEIYGHLERLDEALQAIKKSARTNKFAKQKVEQLCLTRSPGGQDWLYTPELIERLCN